MQLIAASKMQRAQQMVKEVREYSIKMQNVFMNVMSQWDQSNNGDDNLSLMANRDVNNTLMLIVSPDRGLAGALVGNLNRLTAEFINNSNVPVKCATIGRKAERFVQRSEAETIRTFSVDDRPTFEDTVAISNFIIESYEKAETDRVVLVFAEFVNTAIQKPILKQILPLNTENTIGSEPINSSGYIFEPNPATVLNMLVPRYIQTQVYHSILEGAASEHSARMVAMRNATDNANEMIDQLTLDLNKARQEQITGELLDIVGGVAAVEN